MTRITTSTASPAEPQKFVIITRHQGVIDWCTSKNIIGKCIKHLNPTDIESNVIYVGIAPLPLIEKILKNRSRFWMATAPLNLNYRYEELSATQLNEMGMILREVCYLETIPINYQFPCILGAS